MQTLLPDVVAPETDQNDHSYSLCEFKLSIFMSLRKNFVWARTLKMTKLSKSKGGRLHKDGRLHEDGRLPGTIW